MKTSAFQKGSSTWARARLVIVPLCIAGGLTAACGFTGGFSDDNVPEGDRCNPYSSHNDCASGLVCTIASGPNGQISPAQAALSGPVVPFCPENYCCSVDSNGNINSSNPICQPGCAGGAASICTGSGDPTSPACACAGVLDDGGSTTSSVCQPPPPMRDAAPASMDAGSSPAPDAATTG